MRRPSKPPMGATTRPAELAPVVVVDPPLPEAVAVPPAAVDALDAPAVPAEPTLYANEDC